MNEEAYRREEINDTIRESRMEEWEEERQLGCDHEGAYPQETRVTVWGPQYRAEAMLSSISGKTPLEEIREGVFRSTAFILEVEHYCPKCGKTEWIVCDLDDEMFGESDELLGND
jgi:hypothetical protein|tara:strand:+ start:4117 stop:4461 length:345 start_codon:yes stop_codon:yes gene_type:complete